MTADPKRPLIRETDALRALTLDMEHALTQPGENRVKFLEQLVLDLATALLETRGVPKPKVICAAVAEGCLCILATKHEQPAHECICGGSWTLKEDGTFDAMIALPGSRGVFPR